MLPVIALTLPDFRIRDHPELVELLGLISGGRVEAYNPSEDRWDCHSVDTTRQISVDAVLLFRTLPLGLGGRRFAVSKCPMMLEEMNRLKPAYKQTPLPGVTTTKSTPGPSQPANPSTPLRSVKHRRLELAPTPSSKHALSNDMPSSPKPFPFPIPPTPPSRDSHSPAPTLTQDSSQPVGDGMLKDRPLCGKRLYRGGERIWPCSFYAKDIIEGLEKIEILTFQKYPRITLGTAFKMTFGLQWKKSTFLVHNRTYHQNKDLVREYRENGWQGISWTAFVARTREVITVTSDSDSDDAISPVSQASHGTEASSNGVDWNSSVSSDDETPVLDPASTCPFCDLPWPEHPSTKLTEMREALEKISQPDPGSHSANPNHRRIIPATAAGEMCSLHRFETTTIGIAIQRGWPQTIDFTKVIGRIWAMEDALTEIVNDPEASLFYQILKKSSKKLGFLAALGSGGHYAFSSRYGLGTG